MRHGFRTTSLLALLVLYPATVLYASEFQFNSGYWQAGTLVPANAVAFFDQSGCPANWTAYTNGNGRTFLGAGSGNLDATSTSLTIRTYGTAGGHEYVTGIPATTGGVGNAAPSGNVLGTVTPSLQIYTPASGATMQAMEGVALSEGNMLPYVIRLPCKAATTSQVPANMTVPFNGPSCPFNWTLDQTVAGRAIFGAGSGNLDAAGGALTSRTLDASGGREFPTLNAAATVNGTSTNIPDPTVMLGPVGGGSTKTFYVPFHAATFTPQILSGSLTDSNMPPFIALPYCQPTVTQVYLKPGTVMAFDSASCPSGWIPYSAGAGRVIIGAGSGNTDDQGNALSLRSVGQTGGMEYTTAVRAATAAVTDETTVPTSDSYIGRAQPPSRAYATGPATTTLNGVKADSKFPPYMTLTWCQSQ